MSEARDARPNMVLSPYGPGLPPMISAETWRPNGYEGEVMIIVPEAFSITEQLQGAQSRDYDRVQFDVGTYAVPARVRRRVRIPRTDIPDAYTESDGWLNIAGHDEATMHWALKAHKVRHSSNQPFVTGLPPERPPLKPSELRAVGAKFCPFCGTHVSLGHLADCPGRATSELRAAVVRETQARIAP